MEGKLGNSVVVMGGIWGGVELLNYIEGGFQILHPLM